MRAHESERLIEWSFNQFENVKLFNKGDIVEQAPVWMGAQETVPLVAGENLVLTLPVGMREKLKVTLDYNAPLSAPVMKGQNVEASLSVKNGGITVQVPIIAGETVEKANIISRMMKNVSYRLTNKN